MIDFPSMHKENSEDSTGLLFMRAYNEWHSEIKRRLKKVGVTHPQFVVLSTLGYLSQNNQEVTQVMVATMAGMDVMSVSQILKLLEKKQWIIRSIHSKDTRAKAIELTEVGREKMTKSIPIVEEVDVSFFGSLSEDEDRFRSYLSDLSSCNFQQNTNYD